MGNAISSVAGRLVAGLRRVQADPQELTSLAEFAARHQDATVLVTTRTLERSVTAWPGPGPLNVLLTSLYCYAVGRDAIRDPSSVPFWEAVG